MNAPLKLGQSVRATRRPAVPDRPRPLHRQHRARRRAGRAVRALAACPCAARRHRQGRRRSPRPASSAIYTAEDLLADKVGHLPAISEIKDAAGNRHREPAASADAGRQGAPCRRHRRHDRGRARSTRRATRPKRWRSTTRRCRPSSRWRRRWPPVRRWSTTTSPGNLMCRWGKGDAAATDAAFAKRGARHDARHPLAAPDRALHGDARRVVGLRRRPTTSSPSPSPRRACRSRTG